MSDLAGQLEIRLDSGSGDVAISSSRPVTAARVFVGKTPAEVVRQLPTLFSLCGTAQAAACVEACERALGRKVSAAVVARRQALVDAETIKEHLWRLLLDWPQMLALKSKRAFEPKPSFEPMTGWQVAATSAQGAALADERAACASPPILPHAHSAMPRVMRAFMSMRQAQQAAGDPFTLDAEQGERGTALIIDPIALAELVAEQALGMVPGEWLMAVDAPAALQRWADGTTTPAASLVCAVLAQGLAGCGGNTVARLPPAPWSEIAASLASVEAEAYIATPHWQQHCAETGPLARVAGHPLIAALLAEYGNGLLTRLAALLVELALSADRLEAMIRPAPDGDDRMGVRAEVGAGPDVRGCVQVGIGSAEAARGLLVHRVSIVDGRVAQYQILAPTEWNFHPQGVVAQGLAAIARSGAQRAELEHLARLYITAVDPCVDYQLSVS